MPIIHLPLDNQWETIYYQLMLNDRFWTKVKRPSQQDCWEWQANKNNKGYGMFSVNSYVGKRLAHRLSYEDAFGPIEEGAVIRHTCDNPSCVNPNHLVSGTQKQNMQDAAKKERVGNTRLSAPQVIALLRDYVSGLSRKELCTRYRVRATALSSYTDGKAWTHLHGINGCPTLSELEAAKRRRPGAIIDADTAREIRSRLSDGARGIDLAAEYGIHKATISDIKLGKIWRDP